MLQIIQWNIHGYRYNYIELQTLIKIFNPLILALQETYITNFNSLPIPINYTLY